MTAGKRAGQAVPVPRLAVIIVNWNSGGLLRRSLTALAGQTEAPARVIVVDNASHDGSADDVEQIHPGTEVLRLTSNLGFAAANNLAASRVGDCDWLVFLNPDAFPEPDWLACLLRAIGEEPDYACFACRLLMDQQPALLDGAGDAYHVSGAAWREGHGSADALNGGRRREVFAACAAAAAVSRQAFVEAGGFDERYFCYFEDVDLGFRLRLLGHRCLYLPEAVVRHVGGGTTGKASDFAVYHGHRNLVWTYFKDMPTTLLWRYLPAHLLFNLISVARYAFQGRAGVIFRAKWDAMRGLPAVWRDRRAVQGSRRVSGRALRGQMLHGLMLPYLNKQVRASHTVGHF